MVESVNSKGQILDGHIFVYPKDEDGLTINDLHSFIARNQQYTANYQENMKMYTGDHDILHQQRRQFGPDNHLVANLPHYIVDTYNGFFTGIPPKISLDDDASNDALQDWNNNNSFQDKLSEISKQTDIYGRSFAFIYQDEDSQTKIAYMDPTEGFMVYDDTVAREPYCFVRYWKDAESGRTCGAIYYADHTDTFDGDQMSDADQANPYQMVPAVEFYGNEERQGVFDNVKTLINSLDKVLSQKANQVEYFDNAYLKILGIDLDKDGDGLPDANLLGNQMIYSPDADATNATVDFISKPDGDTMQEHIIDRLVALIYQVAMVPNLNDEAFSGNSSGVALQYKLLSMRNMASNKERKFTEALRQMYRIVFSTDAIVHDVNAWQDLNFQFKRNLPDNLADEAQTASTLSGIVSKQTQLSILSCVDDPKTEMQRIKDEQADQVKQAIQNQASAVDAVKGDDDGKQEHGLLEEKAPARDGLDEAEPGQRRQVQSGDR
jgi:SPP1 family phage portal protein